MKKNKETQDIQDNQLQIEEINKDMSEKRNKDMSEKKYSFTEAAQIILKNNGNKPMTSSDIWSKISEEELVKTEGKTPIATLNSNLMKYSPNSNVKKKYKKSIFEIVDSNPVKFKLIKPSEIQNEEKFEEVPNVYCVRAGQANKDADLFIEGNFVGIDYDTKGFDISVKSKEEILQFLSNKYQNKRSIQQYLQQIEIFKEIQEGDIILVPDSEGTNIGEVVSDIYLYDGKDKGDASVNRYGGEYPNRINMEWIGKIEKNPSLNIPKTVFRVNNFDTDEMKFEKPTKVESEIYELSEAMNPFGGESTKNSDNNTSAICVLGESGAGKTYRIEKTLEKEGHISEIIIPSSSTTNLLVQYTKGDYVLSRLGNFILKANSDKSNYYTIVFDECHKYIEMINDELLQCISTKRNDGLRFISLDPVTDKLFSELPENNGRRIIPDNLGFIFISSKESIIRDNSDFYNRVDIITISKSDRDIEFTIKILKNKIESREDEEYSM